MDEQERLIAQREDSERTSVLANERTYAAWLRTGLTALAAGLGIEKFLGDGSVIPNEMIRTITLILIATSGFCFYLAAWRYQHVGIRMMSCHVSGAPIFLMVILSAFLVLTSVLALIGLWL